MNNIFSVKSKKILFTTFIVLAAVMMMLVSCSENEFQGDADNAQTSDVQKNVTELGEGAVQFTFEVTDTDKKTETFLIKTDKTIVGDALIDLGLISGDDGPYGLYVKTVNGITADYDKDGTYWAFYINGEYAMTGVDTTDIVSGDTYSFKVEK